MKKAEIKKKFDEIVDFAGIEKFLDTPVKRYSSGMHVRLAFAVAAHLDSEIMIIDEVLAVGDTAFQGKCIEKMGALAKGGRTILFVSHNMAVIQRLCNRGIVLSSGSAVFSGTVQDAVQHYLGTGRPGSRGRVDLRNAPGWEHQRRVILTWVSTHCIDGSQATEFATGQGMIVKIGYDLGDEVLSAFCQVNILNILGERLITLRSFHNGPALKLSGEGIIQCTIPDIRLASGEYILMLEIGRQFPSESFDCVPDAVRIRIHLGDYLGGFELLQGQGIIAQQSDWSVFVMERTA